MNSLSLKDVSFVCYCGKYDWLMPLFCHMFNHLFDDSIKVFVISHLDLDADRWPSNFQLFKAASNNFTFAALEFCESSLCSDKILWQMEDLILYKNVEKELLLAGLEYLDKDDDLWKFALHFYPGNLDQLEPSPRPSEMGVALQNKIKPYHLDDRFILWNIAYSRFGIAIYKTPYFIQSLKMVQEAHSTCNCRTPHQWENFKWHGKYEEYIKEKTLLCSTKVVYPCVDFVRSDNQRNKIGRYVWRKWEAFDIPSSVWSVFDNYCKDYEDMLLKPTIDVPLLSYKEKA